VYGETSVQVQGPKTATANEPACTTWPVGPVEEMDVDDNEHSSEDWNPGESAKQDIKGKGKQRQHETDHEMGSTTDAGVTRRTYRQLAKVTGSCHVLPCSECQKKNLDCEKESAGGACVRCYTQKAKCDKSWGRGKGGQRVQHAGPMQKRPRTDPKRKQYVHTDEESGSVSDSQFASPVRRK
jgi:hypothetical protein